MGAAVEEAGNGRTGRVGGGGVVRGEKAGGSRLSGLIHLAGMARSHVSESQAGGPNRPASLNLFSFALPVCLSVLFLFRLSLSLCPSPSLVHSVAPALLGQGWVDYEQGLPRHSQCLCVMSLGVELQGGGWGEGCGLPRGQPITAHCWSLNLVFFPFSLFPAPPPLFSQHR